MQAETAHTGVGAEHSKVESIRLFNVGTPPWTGSAILLAEEDEK